MRTTVNFVKRGLCGNSRPALVVFCLLAVWNTACASGFTTLECQPDASVGKQVDALVLAARAAYESDDAHPAYEKALDEIAETIRQRRLSQDYEFLSRYRQFVEYIETASLGHKFDHQLGFIVPNEQYFAETRQYVEIPEFLLNQSFLRSVSRYETLAKAKSFLRLLNSKRAPSDKLIFFSYKSRHLGTPDNEDSYQRLLIVVPGNAKLGIPEKWVQFGVTDPGERMRVRTVSVVSALPNSDRTFNTYFKDYYRTYRPRGSITIKGRWELGEGANSCVECHKSGVLPIFPGDGSVNPAEKQAVLTVNRRLATYGSPRFDKYLDETKLGPGLASAKLADRTQRFGKAFGETDVAKAMSCTACHQHQDLGALNWPMDRIIISSFIKGGQMPPGYNLTVSERSELYEKAIEEYFAIDDANPGILKSWLLGRPGQ